MPDIMSLLDEGHLVLLGPVWFHCRESPGPGTLVALVASVHPLFCLHPQTPGLNWVLPGTEGSGHSDIIPLLLLKSFSTPLVSSERQFLTWGFL